MVSNASVDLPEPLKPVTTTNWSLGMDKSMFWRLCSLPPLSIMFFLSVLIFSPLVKSKLILV